MKKLSEIVAELEGRLSNADAAELPALYLSLANLMAVTDNSRNQEYLNKIFAIPYLSPSSPILLEAKILQAALYAHYSWPEAAQKVMGDVIPIVQISDDIRLAVKAGEWIALDTQDKGQADEACLKFQEIIALAEKTNDASLKCDIYSHACYCFSDKDLSQAGEYGFLALECARQTNKRWLQGQAFYHLGWWAMGRKIDEDAYGYFSSACEILKSEGACEFYAIALNALSIRQKDRGEYDLAITSVNESKEIFLRTKNVRMVVTSTYTLGRVYRTLKKFAQAEACYHEALDMALANNMEDEAASANGFLAFLYRDMGYPHKAIAYFEKAKDIWGTNIRPSMNSDINKHLHSLYHDVGENDKAYAALLEYTETRFKMQDENRVKETAKMQTKYEAEKRESELREMKIKQQQAELERSESELKAIKAQMNPHFIFNALNSIQEMFFIGDKRLANEHLGKFSQLTREVLSASGKRFITLSEEMDMLTKYLELEGLRFENDFTFTVQVNDENAADDIMLPPMLIQPYIENSIRHGLLHKAGAKLIDVNFVFDEEKKLLSCVVEDNGVGRAASSEINKNRKHLHESFSTSANAKRLELLNQNRDEKIGVSYEDLTSGTKVSILIPVTYD